MLLRNTHLNYSASAWLKENRRIFGDLESFVLAWLDRNDISVGPALLGNYGTGKSNFARRLAHLCAERYNINPLSRIPILIELKEFGAHQDVKGLITHELVNHHGVSNGSFELFQSMNESGRLVIILDGYDEMKEGMTIDSLLLKFIQLGSLTLPKSKVLLFGRPTIFESQSEQNRIFKGDSTLFGSGPAKYMRSRLGRNHPNAALDLSLAGNSQPRGLFYSLHR